MPTPDKLHAKLTEIAPDLGKAQRQAARVMLEDLEALSYLPAGDLAIRAGVHVATVVRLAQRLGFEGYPHLQRSLRSTLSQYPRFLQSIDPEGGSCQSDDASALVDSVFAQARRSLDQLTRSTNSEVLVQVAQILAEARRVLVFGVGIAGPVAEHIASSLRVLGTYADRPVDPVSTIQQLGLIDEDDVVFVIDFHRYYRETDKVARAAVRAGANVIALTDSEVSPLTQSASQTLIAPSDSPTPRTSLVPAFTIAEALIALTAIVNRSRAEQSMRRVDQSYEEGEVFMLE